MIKSVTQWWADQAAEIVTVIARPLADRVAEDFVRRVRIDVQIRFDGEE